MNKHSYRGFSAIVNSDGKPFPDYKTADFLRDQLAEIAPEYGFTVQDVPEGGFIVVQSIPVERQKPSLVTPIQPIASSSLAAKSAKTTSSRPVTPEIKRFSDSLPLSLHPAWRNYLFRWVIVFLLAWVAFSINSLIPHIIPDEWLRVAYQKVPRFNRLVGGIIWFFSLYHLFYILKERFTNTYVITKDGLKSKKGIIARDAHSIKFRDIRGVNLQQDVVDRLLGVGTLEFHTAGSEKAEVVFGRIGHPAYYRDRIDSYAILFRESFD